jgi:hypothetical protein
VDAGSAPRECLKHLDFVGNSAQLRDVDTRIPNPRGLSFAYGDPDRHARPGSKAQRSMMA